MTNEEFTILQFWAMRLNCDSIDVDVALQEAGYNPFDHTRFTLDQAKLTVQAYAEKYAALIGPIPYL